jgi:hypothetical protein
MDADQIERGRAHVRGIVVISDGVADQLHLLSDRIRESIERSDAELRERGLPAINGGFDYEAVRELALMMDISPEEFDRLQGWEIRERAIAWSKAWDVKQLYLARHLHALSQRTPTWSAPKRCSEWARLLDISLDTFKRRRTNGRYREAPTSSRTMVSLALEDLPPDVRSKCSPHLPRK